MKKLKWTTKKGQHSNQKPNKMKFKTTKIYEKNFNTLMSFNFVDPTKCK